MSVDVLLFWGRIVFLVGLYLFILFVVLAMTRDLKDRSVSTDEAAPGELVIVDPAETGLRTNDAFPLASETLIGRSPDNNVPLPDATVSAHHGRLIHSRGRWTIEDLGSKNGTFVNGRRIRARAKVKYGDVMSLGGVSMKLVRQG